MTFLPSLKVSAELMRFDKPIGTWLLLWPTFWALWFASKGFPAWQFLVIFSAGVFLMRSAGCVINDIADKDFDSKVKRTRMRPLACGAATRKQALGLFVLLLALSASLLVFLNPTSLYVALVAVSLASFYPFVKRFSHLPQIVLGCAFSCSIPMVFTAISGTLPLDVIWLMLANVLWTVGYDTYYARVDQDDDIHIGVHSTSILFGHYTQVFIFACQGGMLVCLSIYGLLQNLGLSFYVGLGACTLSFMYQYQITRDGARDSYLRAFLANNVSGLIIFVGIFMDLYLSRL